MVQGRKIMMLLLEADIYVSKYVYIWILKKSVNFFSKEEISRGSFTLFVIIYLLFYTRDIEPFDVIVL